MTHRRCPSCDKFYPIDHIHVCAGELFIPAGAIEANRIKLEAWLQAPVIYE